MSLASSKHTFTPSRWQSLRHRREETREERKGGGEKKGKEKKGGERNEDNDEVGILDLTHMQ
jgi:hypothetical protein